LFLISIPFFPSFKLRLSPPLNASVSSFPQISLYTGVLSPRTPSFFLSPLPFSANNPERWLPPSLLYHAVPFYVLFVSFGGGFHIFPLPGLRAWRSCGCRPFPSSPGLSPFPAPFFNLFLRLAIRVGSHRIPPEGLSTLSR